MGSEPSTPLSAAEEALAAGVLSGDQRSLSRVLSFVEDRTPEGRRILDRLYAGTGRAYRIGITGAPGAGKSTLTDLLTRLLRADGEKVGILAVDPSSPFSGGAILGDRIRMQSVAMDPGVFIRSMASRGSLGGVAAGTEQAAEAMDAYGCGSIIIETVGVGQGEIEVVGIADTTVLVLVPESGDGVQMMKAGLMEAGDVFVINKYDREGGDRVQREVRALLEVLRERTQKGSWIPPIVPTVAIRGEGGSALLEAIRRHRAYLESDPQQAVRRRAERLRQELRLLLGARLVETVWEHLDIEEKLAEKLPSVLRREISPYTLIEEVVQECGMLLARSRPPRVDAPS
jgi:LAO/AO transport system kinase